MSRLYEITAEYKSFIEALESGEIPEEAIADTLEAISGEFDAKIDNIACIIKDLQGQTELIKAEAAKLTERAKRKAREAERLAEYIKAALESIGQKKFESARNQISFRTSRAIKITDEAAFIEWARENAPGAIIVKESVSKTVVGELINTTNIPYAVIEERRNVQIK
jgi:hypothetical protein